MNKQTKKELIIHIFSVSNFSNLKSIEKIKQHWELTFLEVNQNLGETQQFIATFLRKVVKN